VSHAKTSKDGRWHFPNAIRKYGKDAFSHEVLAQSWTLEGANATEEELILQYDTRNPEKGFNLAKGGGSQPNLVRRNPWDDPKYREKRTAQSKELWKDPIFRKNVITAATAALNTTESKIKRSVISKETNSRPEVKMKISAAAKGKKRVFTPEHCANISKGAKLRRKTK
jgi:hypothetical protein